MNGVKILKSGLVIGMICSVAACGGQQSSGSALADVQADGGRSAAPMAAGSSSLWDVFGPNKADQTVQVNRYIWAATLDVLNFLPVQSVDPFTGVIVTGYGRPPGGGRSYRATVHIKDPALSARSLRVSLQTQGGPVSAGTTRAVEDAILSRARQMRIGDEKL